VPDLFSGGAALASFKAKVQGAAATPFKLKPSQRELEAGLSLDKDGNVLTDRMKEAYMRKHQVRGI